MSLIGFTELSPMSKPKNYCRNLNDFTRCFLICIPILSNNNYYDPNRVFFVGWGGVDQKLKALKYFMYTIEI